MAPQPQLASSKTFDDLQGEFCKEDIFVRLIHFWEARNFRKGNILLGLELLLIDTKSATMQAFISANRVFRFKDELKPNAIYKVSKFIIRPCKAVYKVTSHKYGITFTDQTSFVEQQACDHEIEKQKFRIRDFQAFTDIADRHTELFDIIGHIRLINGDNLHSPTPMATPPPALATTNERSKGMVFLHVQLEDGETAHVYLWDTIAAAFRIRWNDSEKKPSVILLTTLNAKTLGGAVTLSSTASTRSFFDSDLAETKDYLARFGAGEGTPPAVNSSSSSVTKLETVSLDDIHTFLKNETPQMASFICIATITDVLGEYGWYFISCTGCRWKMEKLETSLVCTNPECKKPNNLGILRYRFEAHVRDETGGEATFVIFDQQAQKLAGRKAPDLMNEMREDGDNGEAIGIATPQCLLDIVGRKCKFQVKVNEFNFRAARQTITVSRIIEDSIVKDT